MLSLPGVNLLRDHAAHGLPKMILKKGIIKTIHVNSSFWIAPINTREYLITVHISQRQLFESTLSTAVQSSKLYEVVCR